MLFDILGQENLLFCGKYTGKNVQNTLVARIRNTLSASIDSRCQDFKGLISVDEMSAKSQGERLKIKLFCNLIQFDPVYNRARQAEK
jgi:hypothetical protein